MAIRTIGTRVCWPMARNVRQSCRRCAVTATFTISAPLASMACVLSCRSAGVPWKSWWDKMIRRPPVCAIRSAQLPCHSTSTYSAPSERASARMRRRSSSLPLNMPPSDVGRQVTITGFLRPASAAAALGSRTESSRNSTRSTSPTRSRCVRRSAMVSAVTVAQSFAVFISIHQIKKRLFPSGLRGASVERCINASWLYGPVSLSCWAPIPPRPHTAPDLVKRPALGRGRQDS